MSFQAKPSDLTPGGRFWSPYRELIAGYKPKEDWPQRWAECGGTFRSGRMIALTDDPIWTLLDSSRVTEGKTGAGTRCVRRKECQELGLPIPACPEYEQQLADSAKGVSTGELRAIREKLQVEIEAGKARVAAAGYDLKTRRYIRQEK